MSSPANTTNNFFEEKGHIIFPILGVIGGLILIIGIWAIWRGPHRQFFPCCSLRRKEKLSDTEMKRTRDHLNAWSSPNPLHPSSFVAGGRTDMSGMGTMAGGGDHAPGLWGRANHHQPSREIRGQRGASGSLSGAAKVQKAYWESQFQHTGTGVRPGELMHSSSAEPLYAHMGVHDYNHNQRPGYAVSAADDVIGVAMSGPPSAMDEKAEYDAYHSAYGGRTDISRSSDGSSTLNDGDENQKLDEGRTPTGSEVHLLAGGGNNGVRHDHISPGAITGGEGGRHGASSDSEYFSLPVTPHRALTSGSTDSRGNPFSTPTDPILSSASLPQRPTQASLALASDHLPSGLAPASQAFIQPNHARQPGSGQRNRTSRRESYAPRPAPGVLAGREQASGRIGGNARPADRASATPKEVDDADVQSL